MAAENNLKNFEPALRQGFKVTLDSLDSTGASNGDVITYSSSAGAYVNGASVAPALTSAHIFVGNGSDVATDVAESGDLTLANTGAFTIANDAITTAKIANNAVDGTKIAIASQATGSIMYYNGTDWVNLAPGTNGQVLTMTAGIPAWA